MHFTFNSSKSSSCSVVINAEYFTFNFIYFSIERSLVAKLVISGILSAIFLILAIYTYLLTTSCFTTSLSSFKSMGTGTYLSTYNLSTLIFKLFKLVCTLFNSSMSN